MHLFRCWDKDNSVIFSYFLCCQCFTISFHVICLFLREPIDAVRSTVGKGSYPQIQVVSLLPVTFSIFPLVSPNGARRSAMRDSNRSCKSLIIFPIWYPIFSSFIGFLPFAVLFLLLSGKSTRKFQTQFYYKLDAFRYEVQA